MDDEYSARRSRPPLVTQHSYADGPGEVSTAVAAPPTPSPDRTSPRPSGFSPEYVTAMAKVKESLSQMPQRTQPNVWQRLAAGAIGAGTGLVNASGRTRIDPNVTQSAVNNITGETGYQRKVGDWRQRLDTQMRTAQLEEEKRKAQEGMLDDASRRRTEAAHAGYYEGEEARSRAAANRPAPPEKPTILPRGGRLVNSAGGLLADNPIPPVERPDRHPNAPPGTGVWNDDTQKYEVPVPAREPVDRGAEVDARQARRAVGAASATEKVDLNRAEDLFSKAKRDLDMRYNGQPDPKLKGKKRPNTSDPNYDRELTALEDQLLAGKRAAGERRAGAVAPYGEVYQVPSYPHPREQRRGGGQPAPSGGGSAAMPNQPRTVSRRELVAAALAQDKDPEAAIASAIKKGYSVIGD